MKTKFTILIMLAFVFIDLSTMAQVPQFIGIANSQFGTFSKFRINGDGSGYIADSIDLSNDHAYGAICKANNGKIYGKTHFDGGDYGYIYSIDPINFTHHIIQYGHGGWGDQSFMQASNGYLYYPWVDFGIPGAIFKIDPSNDSMVVVHAFDSSTNFYPIGQLLQASNGLLYGSTILGGTNNLGVLYSFNTTNNTYTSLYNYDAVHENANYLTQVNNGLLYGMSSSGGSHGGGNIFSFDISTNIYTDLHDFDSLTGWGALGNLIYNSNGLLYGTTAAGGNGGGVLFSYNISTQTYSVLHNFSFSTGWFYGTAWGNDGNLLQASDGKIYGATSAGGDSTFNPVGNGAFYSYDISSNVYFNYNVFNAIISMPTSALIEISANSTCNANFTLHADTSQAHHYIGYNNSTGNGPLHYWWSWGDNTYDTAQFPSHVYADSGYYTICLTIADSTGCSSTYCDDSIFLQRTKNSMVTVNIIGTTLGINNPSSQPFTVKVYPNPTNSILNIHQSIYSSNNLIITDLLGNEVYKENLRGIDNTISISTWSAGIYFYEVRGQEGSTRGKFIKQ